MPIANTEAASATGSRVRGLWLLGPLALLAIEIGVLTPMVEFYGPMARLADPAVAMALIFAGVLLLVIAGEDMARLASFGSPWARLAWLAINLGSYGLFLKLNLKLAESHAGGPFWAATWVILAAAVGISAVMACFSFTTIVRWIVAVWHLAVGAVVLGVLLALITPEVRRLWLVVNEPAIWLAGSVLERLHPGESVVGHNSDGNPVLGLRNRITLEVTEHCAEIESLAALVLLGGTLLVAEYRRVTAWRLLTVIAVVAAMLYLVNALRLALLVEIGARTSSKLSVSLAHSRLSEMVLLGFSATILLLTRPWWRGGK